MPTWVVTIKANLSENVCQLRPKEGRTLWAFKVRCESCQAITPNFIEIDSEESIEVNGGTANASYKCKDCKGLMSASIVTNENNIKKLFGCTSIPSTKNPESGVPVLAIDMRGCAPEEFGLDDAWTLVCGEVDEEGQVTGGELEDVDLREEVSDYDEKSGNAVSFGELAITFERK